MDNKTPIRKPGNGNVQVPQDPSVPFNETPMASAVTPIPVPKGSGQGQAPPLGSLIEHFKKDFDIMSLLVVFVLLLVATSSILVTVIKRVFPAAIDSSGTLNMFTGIVVSIILTVIYGLVVFFKK